MKADYTRCMMTIIGTSNGDNRQMKADYTGLCLGHLLCTNGDNRQMKADYTQNPPINSLKGSMETTAK